MREGGEQTREEWVSPARVLQLLLILAQTYTFVFTIHNLTPRNFSTVAPAMALPIPWTIRFSAASTQHNTTYKNQNVQNFQNFNRLNLWHCDKKYATTTHWNLHSEFNLNSATSLSLAPLHWASSHVSLDIHCRYSHQESFSTKKDSELRIVVWVCLLVTALWWIGGVEVLLDLHNTPLHCISPPSPPLPPSLSSPI